VAELTCAVVVVNWNGADVLPACLRSLEPFVTRAEVVVVDNASTDGSADLVPTLLPGARLIRAGRNGGFAAGADIGIRATTADIVLLLNNDAIAAPGWLAAMVRPFAEPGSEDLGAVTGRVELEGRFALAPAGTPASEVLVDLEGRPWHRVDDPAGSRRLNSTGNEVTRSGNGRDRDWLAPADGTAAPRDVFGLNGGCAAVRRAALEDVGLLDESLFMYYEDTELSWRLRRRGWRVEHATDAVTTHRHAASSGTASEFFQVHNVRNRLVVALRHAPWPVVVRAYARTLVRAGLGPHRRRWLRATTAAVRRAPADLRDRRRVERHARVPRAVVARYLVPDR
jgi:GT2 family glycosyltransferase